MEREEIRYYSYQDLDGSNYIHAQIGNKKIELKKKKFSNRFEQKIFVSRPLAIAADIERRKRDLLNKIDEKFNLPRYIDKDGNTITNEAVKRRLKAKGVKPTVTNDAKPTEIGKTGKIDPVAVAKRAARKSKRVVGSVLKAGVNVASDSSELPVKAALTPGRLAVSATENMIKDPIKSGITASSYIVPYIFPSVASDIASNAVELLPINSPLPAPAKRWLKGKSEEFVQSPKARALKVWKWSDGLAAVGNGLAEVGNHAPTDLANK